ncbi:hypothetical protein [Arsenophonus nasoniae]|uniref:Uncharacterized protein n=1 Tax=Arsenophonus nasoniae TaxID=638 RepID=A0ABY8NQ57_9GAMM|nr:hypothetical protein [Arsenophonus nasoniae]WGM05981.1 hypothetical protein QE258_00905 [Arsenophonus nasoniae]
MIDTEQARREGLRWVLLQVVNKARPYPANDRLLFDVGHALYPDLTLMELQKELLFLEGLRLVRLTRPPARSWTATLTPEGVNLVEYVTDDIPGIARPAKYWKE